MINVKDLKRDFPILNDNQELVYLDSAATTQKPSIVIDGITEYYKTANANPHRGGYGLSVKSTNIYENARESVYRFINARSPEEIVFTRNTTEAINLIAHSYGRVHLDNTSEILICISEHHSNILPWQILSEAIGCRLKYFYLEDDGSVSLESFKREITDSTRMVAVAHMSNVLGMINPVKEIINICKSKNIITVIDGAQSTPHMSVDVKELDCDFYTFSGHKLLAPTGIGVLYARKPLLDSMVPFNVGGGMIEYVEKHSSTYAPVPSIFEAGTQNVAGAHGLKLAIDYLTSIGMENIERHERELTRYAIEKMQSLDFVDIIGSTDYNKRGGVISFNVRDVHSHDVSSILDSYNIAIRSGHHCAKPLMKHLGLNSTCRASFYIYNDLSDVDKLIEGLSQVRRWLGYES